MMDHTRNDGDSFERPQDAERSQGGQIAERKGHRYVAEHAQADSIKML